MTKSFYKLMCFATAAAMSLIGCNNDPSSETDTGMDTLYGIPDTGYDAAEAEASPDKDIDWGNTPDPEALPEDNDFYPDTVYGDPGVDFDDSVDNDANIDEDADILDTEGDLYQDDYDEYADTTVYGDVYTEYDADLANDDDEIIGTDDDQ